MMRITKLFSVLLLVALYGCAGSSVVAEDTKPATAADAQMMIEQAEKSRKRAASVEGEWRDTGKIIKQAQAALKKGEYDEAMKLAKKAKMQGEMGYQQAVSQKDVRVPAYVK